MDTNRLDAQVKNLSKRGVFLPKHPGRARQAANEMHEMPLKQGALREALNKPREGSRNSQQMEDMEENAKMIRSMRQSRSLKKLGVASGGGAGGGSDIGAAVPRFYDPLEYWDLSGLPWNVADEGHRHKLHKWLRLYYSTHYLVPILIDIFTRFPLVGMEVKAKDPKIKEFYETLFLDQLNYQEFLVALGREYWTVGEAFPFGSFDEDLGVWEHEELLNPEDIVIEKFPMLNTRQLKIVPPDYLKKLAQNQDPAKEWKMLKENYPELIPYLLKNEHIPISEVLLKQVANTVNSWDDHGTPILMRGLRTLIHEEKLLASQDAIAERLYSPLILAKMGVQDLGDGYGAWMPSQDELEIFRDDLDLALSSDFRLLVHHFGLEIENVFGREQMPRLQDDFDWIERRLMQVFGVNPSLLSAGSNSQPYASSALQAEFLNQILRTFQGYLKKHFQERAAVVAEAHQHYDYEVRNNVRIPRMEEVVEYDDEGKKKIVEKPKLLIPDLEFEVLDLRDEATERQFLQTLRQMGVPIPDQKLMVGVDDKIDDYVNEYNKELMDKTIHQQEAKLKTYVGLKERKLPIPPDLDAEIQQMLMEESGMGMAQQQQMQQGQGQPGQGGQGGGGTAMVPGGGRVPGTPIVMPPPPAGIPGGPAGPEMPGAPGGGLGPGGAGGPVPGGGPPPAGPMQGGPPGAAPQVSMERRPGQPRPSSYQPKPNEKLEFAKTALGWYEKGYKQGKQKSTDESDTVEDKSERLGGVERHDDRTVDKLPQTKKPRRYSIVDWEADDFSDDVSDEPSGRSEGDDQ